ncbi:phosphoinositide 3-kinase adapter protein 1 isoform X1 [Hippoglossus stenolepis]|uniref:phosphoinositide 3-kinase adapter protein 1 isoform X1 n=1 Tax=Hippoglossus stenolepis TaxID=195615 RepID=UPI00159C684C|nr:phosphoinositide 3-kinase adapter protein 1 isoform X1 [Hippoglossus stenolepis]
MEETVSCVELANSKSPSAYEVVILHTAEAQEWAAYLQQILKSSRKFRKRSILLYSVSPTDQLHGYNFEHFHSCKCIVLLLSVAFLDMLCEADLQGALHRLLHPPHRVVVLLCGLSEEHVQTERFDDWHSWRKICSEDDCDVYVSTILEAIADSRHVEAVHESETAAAPELHIAAASSSEIPTKKEEVVSEERKETVLKDEEKPAGTRNSFSEEVSAPSQLTCVTVQPSRVLCGQQEMLFIIFSQKLDPQLTPQVEFSSESEAAKILTGLVENDYTISVAAPAMPAGVVSLAMHIDGARVSLKPVTYYTSMGEVSRFLEKAIDPVSFICQAFDLTSNATQSLDNMLTDSFKSRMPETGFQLFGIRQIEEDNMAAYQRDVELPTLLHFAAKYGLKKLTTILLQCPGALQAYSVMNKHGDYPNTLAEKSGFLDLRQFMDEFVVTADMVKSHFEDTEEAAEVYEPMTTRTTSREIMMKYSGCSEDIYESMLGIDPECAEDLYESMNVVDENPEEAMLRKFFQAKPHDIVTQDNNEQPQSEDEPKDNQNDLEQTEEEEEDPYNLFPEDIYDIVDANCICIPLIQNRPPAPIPRSEDEPEIEETMKYISRVFSDKGTSQSKTVEMGNPAVRPVSEAPTPVYDPYAGMKTPGQRQLISLQERVKVGEITVDEAVQEFKSWQFDHERRANSIRYQQENLKKLRDSITRRHKEREKTGKDLDYEISAPMQRNSYWGSSMAIECAVYEPAPRIEAPPPPVPHTIQRGSWKTGSTSSTSSTESNRLSTHSVQSCSSGTEPEVEDSFEKLPPPSTRPLRPSDAAPDMPPPRIPPRIPERVPENMVHERYISYPTRALPQRPPNRQTVAPPVPRRLR